MAKILVLYHSLSDCTSEMAALVAEGAKSTGDMDVRLVSVAEATAEDMLWCDGVAVGSPTHIGTVSWQLKKYFDQDLIDHWGKIDGKFGCAFSTSGGWGGGAELTCQTITNMLMNYGFLVFGVVDYVSRNHTLHYGAINAKAPRESYAKKASHRLGQRLAEWLAVYVDGKKESHPLITRTEIVPAE
ncbi:flavodoxin family protein [Teredinibacter haidensis]|uniref:flavodoxin family protein n=1 Tax=Teredinibacter haidensis TaxID=2731755 RepID=UPI0009491ED1|nr:flavodoxin family protein [Teredinibacter haidensis]